jgi:hypothetical protein
VVPPVHRLLVGIVYRLSNPYAVVPPDSYRGLSIVMVAKVILTGYFFSLGERVYPLWCWITVPASLIVAAAFVAGLFRLRRYPELGVVVAFILLSVLALFLVLDPLAPPSLQGAAPRYAIYAMPAFLLVLALGAASWRPLIPALVLVELAGLLCLLWPAWSYGGDDLLQWPRYLEQALAGPGDGCIVADGRATDPVARYAPRGAKIADKVDECLGYSKIVLVTSDYRLNMARSMDAVAARLQDRYDLQSNFTHFPAQLTTYRLSSGGLTQLPPARLALPEQDLRLPLALKRSENDLEGFVRLDGVTPSATLPQAIGAGEYWIASNYTAEQEQAFAPGTAVAKLVLHTASGAEKELVLHTGIETAALDGRCAECAPVAGWLKLAHLLGSQSYPGAYRQYEANVWGWQAPATSEPIMAVTVTTLIDHGTFYFWGIVPGARP